MPTAKYLPWPPIAKPHPPTLDNCYNDDVNGVDDDDDDDDHRHSWDTANHYFQMKSFTKGTMVTFVLCSLLALARRSPRCPFYDPYQTTQLQLDAKSISFSTILLLLLLLVQRLILMLMRSVPI